MITAHSYNPLIYKGANEIATLTSIILNCVTPAAIFLLGSSKTYRKTTSIFCYDTPTASSIAHYYLLVLVDKDEEHTLNAVQDKIENNLQHYIPATVIVLGTVAFFAWLSKGNVFAINVLEKGDRLFQSETIIFPTPSPVNEEDVKQSNDLLFKQTKLKTEGFLVSAELHKLRQEYKLSAFMLHQAAEQALRAMLIINTGLKVNTHSIDKLLRYCSMFCTQLTRIFSKETEKEKKLCSLINKAYIDTRYKDDYSITHEELSALTEKIKRIKELFEHCKMTMRGIS